jgi:succinate dehydrogenase / fumarate reductase flavoprotein subunit
MGGLWVDYDLQSTLPGLFVAGEANFSDHGANRLGASALMQALADGTFILPLTVGGYLAGASLPALAEDALPAREARAAVQARLDRLLAARGRRTAAEFHRALGTLLRARAGLCRTRAGLEQALAEIPALREAFWSDLIVPPGGDLNQELERAGRVADYLELAELICRDALAREESCGSHFRAEHATTDGEARRDDARFSHVAAWFHQGEGQPPRLATEPLAFTELPPSERSYR